MYVIVLGDGSTYDLAINCSILYVPSKYEGEEIEQFITSDEGIARMVEICPTRRRGGNAELFDGDLFVSSEMEEE
tara:strand:- start:555 stop:779 length:225 start_codon:yes stop_codon:yes gene_type:complete